MSKVREEIETVTGVKQGRASSEADHVKNLIEKCTELSDEDWAKLSAQSQAWFNEAVDAMNDNKDIPAFPDAAEEKKVTRRGAAKATEPAAWVPQAGEQVVVTTKRNKVFEGEFLELDGDTAVVLIGDEEMEFTADRVLSMVPAKSESGKPDAGADKEPQVGDSVTLTTKRNAVIEGIIVEITDEVVVLDVDGKEAEYERARVTSIVVHPSEGAGAADEPQVGDVVRVVTKRNKEVFGTVAEFDGDIMVLDQGKLGELEVDMTTAKEITVTGKAGKPAARGRREPAAPTTPAPAAARSTRGTTATAPAEKTSKTTKADNGGVSVGTRMREVICENPDAKVEQIGKVLATEKLSFKEATLKIVFKDVQTVIGLLKKLKRLK